MAMRFFTAVILGIYAVSAYSENALLTGISVNAGSRGLALVIESDEPAVVSFQNFVQGKKSVLTVTLQNIVYGLDEFSFSDFPAQSPVSEIVVREDEDGSLILTTLFREQLYEKTRAKRVKNRYLFFLSSEEFPKYTWKVSQEEAAEPIHARKLASSGAQSECAVIESVRFLKRGRLEQLIISTDNPARIKATRRGGMIIVVFENTENGLAKDAYDLPHSSLFKTVTIKESVRSGRKRVGICIENVLSSSRSSFIEIKPRQCVLFAVPDDSFDPRRLALWTSDGGKDVSYEFISASALGNIMPASITKAKKSAGPAKGKRLVVTRDKVNFREQPMTDTPDNIIMTLSRGMTGTSIKKQGSWYFLRLDEGNTEGWLYASMAAESTRITSEQWKLITRERITQDEPDVVSESRSIEKIATAASTVPSPSSVSHKALLEEKIALKRENKYSVFGRDPFLPLNQGDFLKSELLKVESCKLVGILYDITDRVVLLEDNSKGGIAFSLREKDAILKGRVLKIREREVVFLINEAGFSRKYVLKLNPERKIR